MIGQLLYFYETEKLGKLGVKKLRENAIFSLIYAMVLKLNRLI